VVARTANQTCPDHQQPVTDSVAGGLLTGDFGFAVLLAVDLLAVYGAVNQTHERVEDLYVRAVCP
jgi:hypothetical protein